MTHRKPIVRHLVVVPAALILLALAGCAGGDPATPSGAAPSSAISGAVLAYQGLGPDADRIFLVRPGDAQPRNLANDLGGVQSHPDFSRDGRRLVFDQYDGGDDANQLFVADGEGQGAEQVTTCALPKCAGHAEPPFSPDGTQLVFWREKSGPDGPAAAVYRVDADGGDLVRITPWSLNAGDPDWHPAEDTIVLSTRPLVNFSDGASDLYTMQPDGSGLTRLTDNGASGVRSTQPRWTPDGQAVVYTSVPQVGTPRHIWRFDLAGRKQSPLLTTEQVYTHAVQQP